MLRRLALALSLVLSTILAPLPAVARPAAAAGGTIITQWNFEAGNTTPSIGSGSAAAGSGLGSQTFPSGNGSVAAWSFASWTTSGTPEATDYFEFAVSTVGYMALTLGFAERRSGTGIRNFEIHYSTDGSVYTQVPASVTNVPDDTNFRTHSFDLSSIPALDNNANAKFRIFGYSAEASPGTWRIDDVTFSGDRLPADLDLGKTGPLLADPGATITYTLSIANQGNLTATTSLLTDTLPAQVEFLTFTTTSLVTFTQPSAQTLAWEVGDLAANDLVTLTVTAVVTNAAPIGLTISNYLTATTAATETVTVNNSASANTFIGAPNLAVAKTGPAGEVVAGSQVTFTLAYSNTGNYFMSPVILEDALPSGLTFASASGGGLHSAGTVTWLLGGLSPGVSGTVMLTATATAAGVYTNSVLIYGPAVPETNTTDNRDSVAVTILGPDPYVTKTGPASLQQGKRVTYTIGYGNHGAISTTLTFTDTLPAGFDVDDIAFDNSGLTNVDNVTTRAWLAGTVAGNSHFSFTLALTMPVSVVENDVFTNTLHLTATALGDDPGNNTAAFATTVLAPDPCESAFIEISALQGPTATSPYLGQAVTTRGLVTGDYQGSSNLSGYFLQDEDGGDGDPATSDGLFVFNNSFAVNLGDRIVASGTITEFNTLTELTTVTTVTVCSTGHALAPTVLTLPVATLGDHERYEGMYVTLPQTLTAQQNFFQGRYGQVTLASDGRLYNPTNGNGLGEDLDDNTRRMLVLDDGLSSQNPNPIPYIGADNTLRAGDVVSGLTGLLDYGQINSDSTIRFYRLHPTAPVTFTRANARPSVPDDVGGELRVASFNVLNYFNGDGLGGGFPTSRGADTLAEFLRQETKIITALVALEADVVGLMEIENDGTGAQSALQALVDRLNAETAPGTYAFVAEPDPGSDEIKVALIYQPARVTPVGLAVSYQVTDHITYTGELFDRTPLAQTFADNRTGQTFTVIVNHFKSKGSCPVSGPDLDQGDGQGCWNAKRVAQAAALLDFIADLQADTGDPDVIVIGDLNAYGVEDPVTTLTSGGLVDQAAQHVPAAERYSYIFDGFSGYLDHGLSTPSLNPYITGVTFWHINADEPSVIDYNTEFKPQDLYAPDQFRASDHDPVLIGLDLPFPADLSGSSKSVNTLTALAGGPLTYTLTISNSGEVTTTYQLTDVLDANVTLVSAPGLSGTTTLTGAGSVGPLAQVLYTITVQLGAVFSGTVDNSADLSGDGATHQLDAPTVSVAPPNLSGSAKTVHATAITGGDLLTYTVTISNSGPAPAAFMLTDTLDAHLTLISAPGLSGTTTLTATGVLAGYAQHSFVITVRAALTFSGTVHNTAQLSGDGQLRHLAAPAVTVAQYLYRLFLPLLRR